MTDHAPTSPAPGPRHSRRALLAAAAGTTVAAALTVAEPAQAKMVTDRTVRSVGPVAIIGDSLSAGWMPGLVKELEARDVGPYRFDIRGGRAINKVRRPFDSGRVIVDKMRRARFDPPAWVIALGGNDYLAFRRGALDPATEITTLLDHLGPDARVAWFTIWHRIHRAENDVFNAALMEVAARRPQVRVVDWAPLMREHVKQWSRLDGIHLKGGGVRARNEWLAEAAASIATEPSSPGSADLSSS